MIETIKSLNEKTDNRFIYALGLFCLLSICTSQFPEAVKDKKVDRSESTIEIDMQKINA